MSRIDELIAEHCPDGVEFKTVGDIATYTRGVTYGKNDEQTDGAIRVLRSNNITLSSNTVNFDDVKTVSDSVRVRDNQWLRANDILISAASGSKAHVGKVAYIYEDIEYCFGGFMAVLRTSSGMDSRFLFHLLIGSTFSNHLDSALSTSTINNLNASIMNAFRVPVPHLEVQREIVKVLDTFTKLGAELEAELVARRRQYQYYRDALLIFEEGEVEWKALGEIGDVKMCKRILKSETQSEGDVPFYKIGTFGKQADAFISEEIYESYKSRYSFPKTGDVLISAAGTIGRAVVYDGKPAYFQDSNIVWLDNDESIVSNRYLWHCYKIVNWFVSGGGTIDRLYNDNIKKTKIPVPYPNNPEKSLTEQARIVAILDKFDALVNDLSSGLPAEIKARRQQYEHYRDKLLSFAELEATA